MAVFLAESAIWVIETFGGMLARKSSKWRMGGCLWQFLWVDIWPIFHPFSAHISLAIFQVRLASNPIGQTFKLTFDCVGR